MQLSFLQTILRQTSINWVGIFFYFIKYVMVLRMNNCNRIEPTPIALETAIGMVKRKYLYISNLVEESSREKALELSRHSSELEVIVNLQIILHLLYLFHNTNRRIKCFTSEMHIVKC